MLAAAKGGVQSGLMPAASGSEAAVDVWGIRFSSFHDLTKFLSVLSPEELARAKRFRFEKDYRSFVIARGAMKLLLADYLGTAPHLLALQCNAYGKPFFEERGREPIFFNLAHSADRALVAYCRTAPVGIDIEQLRGDIPFCEIAQQHFSAAENAALNRFDADERAAAFFRCWTRKEAYVKAYGQGLSLALDSFDVSLRRDDDPLLLAVRHDAEADGAWNIHDVEASPGYVAALAVKAPKAALRSLEY